MFVPVDKAVELPSNVVEGMEALRKFLRRTEKSARPGPVIDVFCGLGGLSLGFGSAGCSAALGMEKERPQAATFAANHQKVPVALGDCTEYPPAELRRAVGRVAGVVGGVPCEPFSRARANAEAGAADPRRHLIKYAAALVEAFQPGFFCFENVTGAVEHPNWKAAAKAMARAGYAIGIWRLAASDFGAATTRKRAFFVGARGSGELEPPTPSGRARTVAEAVKGLGEPSGDHRDHLHRTPTPFSDAVRAALRTAKPGGGLIGHGGYKRFGERVLAADAPACTIISNSRFVHPSKRRWMTPRELARIQGIPDSYKFACTADQARSMLGDCVPTELGSAVARRLFGRAAKAADAAVDPMALAVGLAAAVEAVWLCEDAEAVAKADDALEAALAAMMEEP